MIRWCSIFVALVWTLALSGQSDDHRDFLPPYNFNVDSVSLLATWESPKIVLLDEDFENDTFPPAGWTASSLGKGWQGVESPDYYYWHVPQHPGGFALANDDSAHYSNNGSMDFLYTPAMNLTVADSFKLFFDSYFDGGYGQRAFLEYSLDSGNTWQLLLQLDADLDWKNQEVDLSSFSGTDGENKFQLAFHADDFGYYASGWAIDNVVVYSNRNPNQVIKYKVFLDSDLIAQVTTTSYQYNFEFYSIHNCGVLARYQDGLSDTVWQNVRSDYFPKPYHLMATAPDDAAILWWEPPDNPDYLIGYNVYRNDILIAYVYCTEPGCCNYIDPIDYSEESVFLYEVTALYELSEYGFPGEIGESMKEGPAEVYSCCWNELDFFEDWSDWIYNYWKFSGNNWKVDPELGNEAPAAVFSTDSILNQYEDTLQSYFFLNWGIVDIILEYDLSLSSVNATGDEKLLVQVYDYLNDTWNTVLTYDNLEGSFGWRRDTVNITSYFNDNFFRIRFDAQGENSADINYWAIDNIAVRRACYPPKNVQATISPSSEDSVLVSWDEPLPEIAEWWQWDDGEQSSKVGVGVGKYMWMSCAVLWTPDQLANLKDATLTSIGFIPCNGGTFYKIAIWTGENKDLIYTQAAGNLDIDHWNNISLDVPMKVDITRDLMVGYQYSQATGFSMSVDDGPCIDGFGNLYQFGLNQPWTTLFEVNPELDYNWNIKAYFEREGYPVWKYQLFKSVDGNDPQMIAELEGLEYIDTVSSGYMTSCYKLKSVFPDGCESDYSTEACVIFINTDPVELKNDGYLRIFPNPSAREVSIESSETLQFVSIFNSFGKLMSKKMVDEKYYEIQVSDYPAGVYMVRVEAGKEMISRKVLVMH